MFLLKNDVTNGNYLYIQISCMYIQMKLLIFSQNKNISEKKAKSNRKECYIDIDMYLCVYVYVCVCICICVCVGQWDIVHDICKATRSGHHNAGTTAPNVYVWLQHALIS